MIRLSEDVKKILRPYSKPLTQDALFLAMVNQKADRTGSPVFAGITRDERAKRRAAGRRAKASRKANR